MKLELQADRAAPAQGHQVASRQILFLDFDGVLHSATSPIPYITQLPLLQDRLRRHPTVDVVIASTWRTRRSLAQLAASFDEDLRPHVVGMTPTVQSGLWESTPLYTRHAEVTAWGRENAPPGGRWDRYAALDDASWLYPPFTRKLVLTDAKSGLTEADLKRLGEALKVRPYPA